MAIFLLEALWEEFLKLKQLAHEMEQGVGVGGWAGLRRPTAHSRLSHSRSAGPVVALRLHPTLPGRHSPPREEPEWKRGEKPDGTVAARLTLDQSSAQPINSVSASAVRKLSWRHVM